jgi:NAD(P)-dependent dehydrogenase (short-subunit alcohol dehydrogenase family)
MQSLRLTLDDLDRFAAQSGDRNPLHVDEAYARRTPFGERVVFGVLSLLRAVATQRPRSSQRMKKITVDFSAPLFAGVDYSVESREEDAKATTRVLDGKRTLLKAVLLYEPGEAAGSPPPPAPPPRLRSEAARRAPSELGDGTTWRGRYAPRELASLMRELALSERGLAWFHVAALLGSTYVVGMELPGERALFTQLKLTFGSAGPESGPFEVVATARAYDDRFDMLTLDLRMGGASAFCEGEARAIVRRPPIDVDRERVASLIGSDRPLAGKTALVVGASRGLGAATACALRHMGATVTATYATSVDAARRLDLRARRCDASDGAAMSVLADEILREAGGLDLVVLAASPSVLPMAIDATNATRVLAFVSRSLALVATPLAVLWPLLEAKSGTAVVVSSVYVDDPPPDFPHYVAAKGAIESFSRAHAATAKKARVLVARAPRFLSDMTNLGSTEGMARLEDVAAGLARAAIEPFEGTFRLSTIGGVP